MFLIKYSDPKGRRYNAHIISLIFLRLRPVCQLTEYLFKCLGWEVIQFSLVLVEGKVLN